MSYFSDYLSKVYFSPTLPDWDQLGDRLFLVDGVNPNVVLDGWVEHTRIMGAYPQQSDVSVSLSAAGTPAALEDGETYRYGIMRVVKVGNLVIPSAMITDTIENDAGATRDGLVTLDEYEYNPETGSTWTIHYRIYRSKKTDSNVLYLVEEIDQTAYDALSPAGVYTDSTPDASLNMAYEYNYTASELNYFLPPVRYVRAWMGGLIAAGSYAYSLGTATIDAGDKDVVTLASPGQVRQTDVGAYFLVDGEDYAFTILEADETANTYTLSRDADAAHDADNYTVWRDDDVVYALEVLPGNIEGADLLGYAQVYTNLGSGLRAKGVAVSSNDHCYVFRENAVEHLEGSRPNLQLVRLLQGVGCASHATIADRYSPLVIWYAGRAGVWMVDAGEVKRVSTPVDRIIRDEVDHAYDDYTHGVYSPESNCYYLWLFGNGDVDTYGVRVPQLVLKWDLTENEWYVLELMASASGLQRRTDGTLGVVIGIAGGTAWLDEDVSYDGVSASGTVTSGGNSTLTDSGADFSVYATLAGIPVHKTASDGTVERRIIKSKTDTELTIYGTWDANPVENDTYLIGGIRYWAESQELEYRESFDYKKKFHRLLAVVEPDSASNTMTVKLQGVREDAGKEVSQAWDLNGLGAVQMKGESLGLRGRSCKLRVEGNTLRPVKMLSVAVESEPAKRS